MRNDVTGPNSGRENLPASRRANLFTPWSNNYWEPARWFDDFLGADVSVFPNETGFVIPPIDIDENSDEYLVSADMPGIKKEDISIDCAGNVLSIKAERKYETSGNKKENRRERFYGTYQRSFTMPAGVDVNKIDAAYESGVLKIHIPKGESVKSRKIQINESKMKETKH